LARRAPGGLEPVGLGFDVGGVDVEVHAVLGGLGFGDLLEEKLGAGLGPGRRLGTSMT
jgi:hypothetical protein